MSAFHGCLFFFKRGETDLQPHARLECFAEAEDSFFFSAAGGCQEDPASSKGMFALIIPINMVFRIDIADVNNRDLRVLFDDSVKLWDEYDELKSRLGDLKRFWNLEYETLP